jgi:hypothetical protein
MRNNLHRYATDANYRAKVNSAGGKVWAAANAAGLTVQHWAKRAREWYAPDDAALNEDGIGSSAKETNPQNVAVKTYTRQIRGASSIFAGGEVVGKPMSLRLGTAVAHDNIPAFLDHLNKKGTMRIEFVNQFVGDDQTRSCHMMVFRHRATLGSIAGRILKPTATFSNPVIGASTVVSALHSNFFDTSRATCSNGKVMYAGFNLGDIEENCMRLLSYNALERTDPITATTFSAAPLVIPTAILWNPLDKVKADWTAVQNSKSIMDDVYAGNNPTLQNNNPTVSQHREYRAVIRDGGVTIDFQNKHPTGCFVEIIVVKLKETHVSPAISLIAATADQPLFSYTQAIGTGYLRKITSVLGSDDVGGRAPKIDDVFSSPYFPLLPPDPKNVDASLAHFSEKSRQSFALSSGAKRTVKLSFGGKVYDPNQDDDFSAYSNMSYGVIIAVNGQQTSAILQQGTDHLISGDACTGHNLNMKCEYYEHLQACKLVNPDSTNLFIRGQMEPKVVTASLPAGVTYHPYQILAANAVLRGNGPSVSAGNTFHQGDGNLANDPIQP